MSVVKNLSKRLTISVIDVTVLPCLTMWMDDKFNCTLIVARSWHLLETLKNHTMVFSCILNQFQDRLNYATKLLTDIASFQLRAWCPNWIANTSSNFNICKAVSSSHCHQIELGVPKLEINKPDSNRFATVINYLEYCLKKKLPWYNHEKAEKLERPPVNVAPLFCFLTLVRKALMLEIASLQDF